MSYTPKFKDKRIQQRIKTVLGFVKATMSPDTPHDWPSTFIDKHIGQLQNDLSKWLRDHLLIVTDDYYNSATGQCKMYKLNQDGYNFVKARATGIFSGTFEQYLENKPQIARVYMRDLVEYTEPDEDEEQFLTCYELEDQAVVDYFIRDNFQEELETGDFHYKEQSRRLWHPLQNVRREHKQHIFKRNDYNFSYDIECCAPTLIHQHAQHNGMDLYLFEIREYIKDRSTIRNQVAQYTGIDPKDVKVIINALLAGAQIGFNPDSAIFQMLNGDADKINKLKQCAWINDLREDIKVCWEYIKPTMYRTGITTKTGQNRLLPVSSKQKWNRYFDLERQVLDVVIDYLKQRNCRYFLEHDGFSTDCAVDQEFLKQEIYNKTGLKVTFDMK